MPPSCVTLCPMKATLFYVGYFVGMLCGLAWGAYAVSQALQFRGLGNSGWAMALLVCISVAVGVVCILLAHQEEQRKKGGEKPANPPTSAPDIHGGG
jgi:uncharacterized membrane protein